MIRELSICNMYLCNQIMICILAKSLGGGRRLLLSPEPRAPLRRRRPQTSSRPNKYAGPAAGGLGVAAAQVPAVQALEVGGCQEDGGGHRGAGAHLQADRRKVSGRAVISFKILLALLLDATAIVCGAMWQTDNYTRTTTYSMSVKEMWNKFCELISLAD